MVVAQGGTVKSWPGEEAARLVDQLGDDPLDGPLGADDQNPNSNKTSPLDSGSRGPNRRMIPIYETEAVAQEDPGAAAAVGGGLGLAQGAANVANKLSDAGTAGLNIIVWVGNLVGPSLGMNRRIPLEPWHFGVVRDENDVPAVDPETQAMSERAADVGVNLALLAGGLPRALGGISFTGGAASMATNLGNVVVTVPVGVEISASGAAGLGATVLGGSNLLNAGKPSDAGGPASNNPSPRRGPTDPDVIAEEMGPGHFDTHGDPNSWKYLGKKTEPATEIGREAGSKKVYEVYLDENGKQIEWHYWRNPDGTVDGGKLKFPGTTSRSNLAD
jgi:hypothetical protein